MKKRVFLLIFLIVIGMFCVDATEEVQVINTFYVAMDGSDTNDGSIESPFASLEAARDAIRIIKENGNLPKGGICIYVRNGIYFRNESFELTNEDSGTKDCPITYRAYKNESVKFVGGIKLNVSDFRRVSDENILKRIYDNNARKFIYQYDLSQISGFDVAPTYTAGTNNRPNELVCDNEIMTIARWPNIDSKGDDAFTTLSNIVNDHIDGKGSAVMIEDIKRANNWKTADNMRLFANWVYYWTNTVTEVDNIKNGIITTKTYSGTSDQTRFYAANLLEEIDVEGEYFIDRKTKILYFYPPSNSTNKSELFISLLDAPVFKIDGASYITFKNFSIPCSRGNGFSIDNAEHNLVAYCDIRNLGRTGIVIGSGYYNGAVGNYVSNCDGGINIAGGDMKKLISGGNYAENNETTKFSRITKAYTGGLSIGGVGNRLSHNKVHDGLHLAMQFSGNENLVEYNEFYDVLKSVEDSGAIYAGDSFVWRGNIIEHNWFHDLTGKTHGAGLGAIYCDDNLANVIVRKNLFTNISGRGIWAEAGSDHIFKNNIMVNVGTPIRFSDRGNDKKTMNEVAKTAKKWYTLEGVPYTTKLWTEKYPILKQITQLRVFQPWRNDIQYNVAVNCGPNSIEPNVEKQGIVKDNISVEDPGFTNMKNGDYSLKSDAQIYKTLPKFENINFEKMGMYTDKLREKINDSIVIGIDKSGAIVNGEKIQIDESNDLITPIIENENTMIPLRFIGENLGYIVTWDAENQRITISNKETTVQISISERVLTVNGEKSELLSPAIIHNGRTFIPLRAVAQAFGIKIFWDDKGLIVLGDKENIFKSDTDDYLINELLRQINLR